MKVDYQIVYPASGAEFPSRPIPQKVMEGYLVVGCSEWMTNETFRRGFCDLIFAGCGNHPGNEPDQSFGAEYDSGDPGINRVHRQWEPYRTRSMSVGDLVRIVAINEWWLCDVIGWVKLTKEQADSWRSFPRQFAFGGGELRHWKNQNGLE